MANTVDPPELNAVVRETLLGTAAIPEVGSAAYEEEAVDAAPDAEADTFRVEFAAADPEAGMAVGKVIVGVGGRKARGGVDEGGRVEEGERGNALPVQLQDNVKLK